jgi:hypothetical protein
LVYVLKSWTQSLDVRRKSTDLTWEEAGTSMAADGRSRSAETEMTAPPPQDQSTKDVSVTEASAAAGLCLLRSKVVKSLIASFV